MFPWIFIISTTARAIIQSLYNPSPLDLPPFTDIDNFTGQLTIVEETGDPNNPTTAFSGITGAVIKLIGATTVTATAVVITQNVIVFNLNLLNNIAAGEAVLEVVITTAENSICILNLDVVIQEAG